MELNVMCMDCFWQGEEQSLVDQNGVNVCPECLSMEIDYHYTGEKENYDLETISDDLDDM